MEDVIIIQVDSNSLSDYLNVIANAGGRGTLVQLYKSSCFGYVLLCLEFSYCFIMEKMLTDQLVNLLIKEFGHGS